MMYFLNNKFSMLKKIITPRKYHKKMLVRMKIDSVFLKRNLSRQVKCYPKKTNMYVHREFLTSFLQNL